MGRPLAHDGTRAHPPERWERLGAVRGLPDRARRDRPFSPAELARRVTEPLGAA